MPFKGIYVVGFSRGAAEARAWVNQVAKKLQQGSYTSVNGNRRCLNFRFLGLWDTAPHLGADHGDEKDHNFRIPALVKYAVHAVAVNEHRGGWLILMPCPSTTTQRLQTVVHALSAVL